MEKELTIACQKCNWGFLVRLEFDGDDSYATTACPKCGNNIFVTRKVVNGKEQIQASGGRTERIKPSYK